MDDLVRATQCAAFYSVHSGQNHLVLNHIEPHYKDKVGSVTSGRHLVRKSSSDEKGVSNLTRWRSCCIKESKGELCGGKEKMNSIGQPVPELPVADVERAQRHYRDALGFEVGWLYPGKEIGAVSRGDVAIFFRKRKPPFEPAVHWVFAEDIDASYRELKSSGANIVDPLEKKPWGLRQFTVKDLDGNLFYFHHD
jgi:uncharacterized glyoxalase superfamily protein PhnB